MKRFFIPPENITGDQARLEGPEAYHLRTVMRLGPGDRLVVFDGTGDAYSALITSADKNGVRLTLTGKTADSADTALDITLAQGYLKDKKMDDLVRPLTELGLTRWMPFMAARSIPAPDPKRLETRLSRWRKLSLEAMKQCRRNHPLTIDPPCTFDDILSQADSFDIKILFWEAAGSGFSPEPSPPPENARVLLMLGPEGGFDNAEIDAARSRGFLLKGMGPRILRAQTAALAACALIQYLWGDMGLNTVKSKPKTA